MRILAAALLLAPGLVAAQPSKPVQDFVRQGFIHGVPYAEASQYGAGDVSTLVTMLRSQGEEAHWVNVVVTLGFIGDASAVRPLINFLESTTKCSIYRREHTAQVFVPFALGLIVNRSGDAAAARYLDDAAANQTSWFAKIPWSGQKYGSSTYGEQLMNNLLHGLAISGTSAAGASLRAFAASPSGAAYQEILADALPIHDEVSRNGLAAYYSNR